MPFWHKLDCRLRTDGSSTNVYVTASAQIVLFDRKEIQEARLIANSPRTATAAFQLGGSISFNEEPWRRMLQEGRGRECPFPTPISSQASLQAKQRVRGREGFAPPTHADSVGFQFGDSVSLNEASGRITPQDGGESWDLFPTSASFQSTLQAQESSQASSRSVLYSHAADESTACGPEIAIVASVASSVNAGCYTCGMSFISIQGVANHTRRSACLPQNKCRLCDFQCHTYEDLDEHGELVHKGKDDYMYMCPLCNKGFKKRKGLTKHQRRHVR